MRFIYTLVFLLVTLSSRSTLSAETLSYSGRLVNSDGSPVTGPVNLRFDVSYSGDPTTVLCFKTLNSVPLSNGVFHAKLDFATSDCGAVSFSNVLLATPPGQTTMMRVVDVTNTKSYSYQAFQTMPYALIADKAKTLSPLPASDTGKVL